MNVRELVWGRPDDEMVLVWRLAIVASAALIVAMFILALKTKFAV